jgi:hypothetical protein
MGGDTLVLLSLVISITPFSVRFNPRDAPLDFLQMLSVPFPNQKIVTELVGSSESEIQRIVLLILKRGCLTSPVKVVLFEK